MAAAFAGAWAAFKLENSTQNKLIEDENVASGNRALFTLLQIWNKQKQYQKEIIDSYRSRDDAWFNLPAGSPISDNSLVFDMKELSFVLQSKGSIFQFVFLEADRFRDVAQLIDKRSELILSEVFPRLSAAGIKIGQSVDSDKVKQILTAGVVRQLEILTAGIVKNMDENIISSRAIFNKLRAALKEIYPKRKFIDFAEEEKTTGDNKKSQTT